MPTPTPSPHPRINLGELKSQISRRLGPERSNRYFGSLSLFLACKLSKPEFNRVCLWTLGHDNIPLHNQLLRSLLKNASQAKTPPPIADDMPKPTSKPVKPVGVLGKKSPKGGDGFTPPTATLSKLQVWFNGDVMPPSPRRVKSGVRDRRIKASPFVPNGRVDVATHQSLVPADEVVARENGGLSPCNFSRLMQHRQDGSAEHQAKRQRTESKGFVGVAAVEDREGGGKNNDLNCIRGPLQAPLGIPFCPASVGAARRSLPTIVTGSSLSNYSSGGELWPTEVLRQRMEKVAEAQGLGGVTIDCANVLYNGLDMYLKQLIKSCVELVGARSGRDPTKQAMFKQQPHGKPINGVWPRNHVHVQSSGESLEAMHEVKSRCISLQDFKVAMELNPQQLGEEWPFLLEKICLRSFEE